MSPTSSRKSVPPLACSNHPLRSRSAPVKAPLTWPNSSLSRMFSLRAAQLSGTNGLYRRGLLLWIALATSSLPVPLSPVIRTVADGRGDLAEPGDHRVHQRRVADHPLEAEPLVELLLELDVRPRQPLRLRDLVGDRPQLVDVERLGQVGGGAGLHGGDGGLDRAVAGQDHDLGVGQLALGLGQDLQAADLVHDQVGDHDVEGLLLDQPEPLAAAGGDDALVADALEALGDRLGVRLVVVDHQDADLLVHRPARRSGVRTCAAIAARARARLRSIAPDRGAAAIRGSRMRELRALAGLALDAGSSRRGPRRSCGWWAGRGRCRRAASSRRRRRRARGPPRSCRPRCRSRRGRPTAPSRRVVQDQLAAVGHGVLGVEDQVQAAPA